MVEKKPAKEPVKEEEVKPKRKYTRRKKTASERMLTAQKKGDNSEVLRIQQELLIQRLENEQDSALFLKLNDQLLKINKELLKLEEKRPTQGGDVNLEKAVKSLDEILRSFE